VPSMYYLLHCYVEVASRHMYLQPLRSIELHNMPGTSGEVNNQSVALVRTAALKAAHSKFYWTRITGPGC
jgi:hypothetical protein